MITLKDFMESVDYRVTEGSEYCWRCYGSNAYSLDSWNGEDEGHSVCIVFDTKTQVVYEMAVYDYANNRAYRLTNPDFIKARETETENRGMGDEAWDDVQYIDLDVEEDMLEKVHAIVAGEDYDTRVQVPLELDDDLVFELMKLAHERDITLNKYVEEILREMLNRVESGKLDETSFV
jgi:hypothetical protein